MKRKAFIFISILLLLLGGLAFLALNNHIILWNTNSVIVTVDKPLVADKVKINYGMSANSYNRPTENGIFSHIDKYNLTLYDKISKAKMPNEYGENDFLITYDNKYFTTFRHFKTNWKHQHKYYFHFYTKGGKIFVRANITGVDYETFDREMLNLITQTDK